MVAAGYGEAMARDERGVVGGEEEYGSSDVGRIAEALEGYVAEESVDELLGHIVEQGVGSYHTGHYAVATDALAGVLRGDVLGERHYGRFGDAIGDAVEVRVVAADRADIDDGAALRHVGHSILDGDEDGVEVGADRAVEELPVGVDYITVLTDVGSAVVVDEDVDTAFLFHYLLHHRFVRLELGSVEIDGGNAATFRIEAVGNLQTELHITYTDIDAGTAACETFRASEAYSPAGCHHQGHFIFEFLHTTIVCTMQRYGK